MIGAVLITSKGEFFHTYTTNIDWKSSDGSPLRIDLYEALAVLLAITSFEKIIQNSFLNIFVDNTVDCYCFIKASHPEKSTSTIISQCLLELRRINASVFFDYILTGDNIADWTTRKDYLKLLSLSNSKMIPPILDSKSQIQQNFSLSFSQPE